MIQRLQSLFLLCVAGFLSAILFLPIWQEQDLKTGDIASLNAYEITYIEGETNKILLQEPTFYIAIILGVAIIIAAISIFQFNKRLLQVKLGMVNSLVMAAALGTCIYFVSKGEPLVSKTTQGDYEVGFYMFVGAMMSNLLANRFIRKDERLVRSVDRLR